MHIVLFQEAIEAIVVTDSENAIPHTNNVSSKLHHICVFTKSVIIPNHQQIHLNIDNLFSDG